MACEKTRLDGEHGPLRWSDNVTVMVVAYQGDGCRVSEENDNLWMRKDQERKEKLEIWFGDTKLILDSLYSTQNCLITMH